MLPLVGLRLISKNFKFEFRKQINNFKEKFV